MLTPALHTRCLLCSTALPLSATAAALSDAQFLPTPATAAVPLGGAAALCPPSSCVARSPPRPEEQNASTQVTAEVVAAGKQAVLPRGVLTAMRGKPEAVPAQHAPDVPPAARPVLAVVTGDTPVPALAPLDEQGGAAPQAGIVGPGKVATQQQQQQEEALHGSQPAREEAAVAAAAASGGPPPLSAAAPAASLSGPGGAAESLLALAQLQHNPCATPLAEGAKVPTPILRVFGEAEAEAGDQVPYHQPRPFSCPPLFKRLQAQPGNTADRCVRVLAGSKWRQWGHVTSATASPPQQAALILPLMCTRHSLALCALLWVWCAGVRTVPLGQVSSARRCLAVRQARRTAASASTPLRLHCWAWLQTPLSRLLRHLPASLAGSSASCSS